MIRVQRRLNSRDLPSALARLFVRHGAQFLEPGSPWANGCSEPFNGTLRDEPLNREPFMTLREARVLVERRREQYNRMRPHSSPGCRPPAPEACEPWPLAMASQSSRASKSGGRSCMDKTCYYVLDLLVDGPSSFASLGVGLRTIHSDSEKSIGALLNLLERMQENDLIRLRQMNPDGSFRAVTGPDRERWLRGYETWIPLATTAEAACDEIGLWVAINPAGMRAWEAWMSRHEGQT